MSDERSSELQFEINQAMCEARRLIPDGMHYALIGTAAFMPNPNDIDILARVRPRSDMAVYGNALLCEGFEMCSKYDAHQNARTTDVLIVRKGRLNLILTRDAEHFERFLLAMDVCRALRLERKVDRVTVCKIVRDGYDVEAARRAAEAVCSANGGAGASL